MSEITKPIMLDETGKQIVEELRRIVEHREYADEAGNSERLGGELPEYYATAESVEGKVDKVEGKGLSSNDYTYEDKSKTSEAYQHSQTKHAPSDAQKNVQADWYATSGDSFIKNKPEALPADGGNADTVDGKHLSDLASASGSNILPYPYSLTFPRTLVGVTYTELPDGSIHAVGIPESSSGIKIADFTLEAGTYTISGVGKNPNEIGRPRLLLQINGVYSEASPIYGRSGTFTITEPSNIVISIQFLAYDVDVDFTFRPMLEVGTVAHDYQSTNASNSALKSSMSMIADNWNSSISYAAGACCVHNNMLYVCLVENDNMKPDLNARYWKKTTVIDLMSHSSGFP